MEHFNQFADSLDIAFICPHCHKETLYFLEDVPAPNWDGESSASSENYDDDDFCCENCGHPYTIDVFVNITDGVVVVTDSETNEEVEGIKVEEYYMDEDENVIKSIMNN